MCFLSVIFDTFNTFNNLKKIKKKENEEYIQKLERAEKQIENGETVEVDTLDTSNTSNTVNKLSKEYVSRNFKRSEFECKCGCGKYNADSRLVSGLQTLRDKIGAPIMINSACRCEDHNRRVGGVPNSQHVQGKAADIRVSGVTPRDVAKFAEEVPVFSKGGIGIYNSFVHVDVRDKKARWKG